MRVPQMAVRAASIPVCCAVTVPMIAAQRAGNLRSRLLGAKAVIPRWVRSAERIS